MLAVGRAQAHGIVVGMLGAFLQLVWGEDMPGRRTVEVVGQGSHKVQEVLETVESGLLV